MLRMFRSGVWDEQFESKHDWPPTTPRVRYALCSIPRSGSHFLGHLLHAAGCFGYPLEYFNPLNFPEWRRRAKAAGSADAVTFLESKRTSPNGCFGIKLHYDHLPAAVNRIGLSELLDGWRFVLLRRNDILAQAISWERAAQTRAWRSEMARRASARYDRAAIAYRLGQVLAQNEGWQRFMVEMGVEPLELAYEDVVADPGGAIRRIADLLDVEPSPGLEVRSPPTAIQRSRTSDEWRERFVAEMRERHRASAARGRWAPDIGIVKRLPLSSRLERVARRQLRRASGLFTRASP